VPDLLVRLERLGEPLLALVEGDAEPLELVLVGTAADAELEPPLEDVVGERDLAGAHERVAVVEQRHHRADARLHVQPDLRREQQRARRLHEVDEVVLGDPDDVGPERVRHLRLRQLLREGGPAVLLRRAGPLVRQKHTKAHRSSSRSPLAW
jgi:hypothetical protein